MTPAERLQKEMAKLGNGISTWDLQRCLDRAGVVLLGGDEAKRYEQRTWDGFVERMGQ